MNRIIKNPKEKKDKQAIIENPWDCKHKWENIRSITDAYAKEKGLEKENERFQVCQKCNSVRDNPKFMDKKLLDRCPIEMFYCPHCGSTCTNFDEHEKDMVRYVGEE